MKTSNRQHIPKKIRAIVKDNKVVKQIGLSLPSTLIDNWSNVYVGVQESGNCLILESGTYTNLRNKNKPKSFNDNELKAFETKEEIKI